MIEFIDRHRAEYGVESICGQLPGTRGSPRRPTDRSGWHDGRTIGVDQAANIMQTPAILTGNYTRPGDLRPFEYEVMLDAIPGGRFAWTARVSSEGVLVGRARGALDNMQGMDSSEIELAIKDAVETLIRNRALAP